MAKPSHVFEQGNHSVKLFNVEVGDSGSRSDSSSTPPKPLLIAAPTEEGDYPVVLFLHGYLLFNSFYSQLFQHVASHGFIVIGPQLYSASGADCSEEIKSGGAVADWLIHGLVRVLPPHIRPNLSKSSLAGHSRGGKVAFALALGYAKTKLKFAALMGIDPVDGMDIGKQTPPPILSYVPGSLKLEMPVMLVGSGLGEVKKNLFFPPCAPKGVSHQQFFDECCSPSCHFVAKDYGHTDMLDDDTKGIRGKATYCACKNGKARKPMREFVGGIMVAFMEAYLEGDSQYLVAVKDDPEIAPVELSTIAFHE
ncbi:chlorophyllase-2 [Typha latifolia]|uniref:chlorophyllase-2 n=1 Tax=Typha latifolia TaxID=4733 RepID=UPI003C2B1947